MLGWYLKAKSCQSYIIFVSSTPHVHTIKFRWFLRASFHLLCILYGFIFARSPDFIEIITGCVITFQCTQVRFYNLNHCSPCLHFPQITPYIKWNLTLCSEHVQYLILNLDQVCWKICTIDGENMGGGYLFILSNSPLKIVQWSVMNLMTAYHKIPWYFIYLSHRIKNEFSHVM